MPKLGVLFDIKELGGGAYAHRAYAILFNSLDRSSFFECAMSDGDVVANGEFYCIAIEPPDLSKLYKIKSAVFRSNSRGLAKRHQRFVEGPSLENAPLENAAYIDSRGQMHNCETWYARQAWELTSKCETANVSEFPTLTESDLRGNQNEAKAEPGEHSPGEIFGKKYLILDVRKGGMGLVYIAEDLNSLKENIIFRVALKTFQARYLWDTTAIHRFEREALNWVRIGKHPNIVHAMLVQQIEGKPYIWLEFVDGWSLAQRLSQNRMSVNEVLDVALQFCDGILYAQENHGLIHRDVKPGNIMISHDGVVKITDFGLSKIQAEFAEAQIARSGAPPDPDEAQTISNLYLTGAGVFVGTPAYIAPEAMLDPSSVDTRTDIYSFGIVLFEMLTGVRPFHGRRVLEQQVRARPPAVRSLNPDLPPQLDDIVNTCLMKDPNRRYRSFAQLQDALKDLAGDQREQMFAGDPEIAEKERFLLQGFSFMELGKFQEGIDWFERVLKIDDQYAEAYNNIGVCQGNLKNFQDAAANIEKAVAIRADYAEAWANLGTVYYRLKRYEDGIRACNRAILLKPDWAEAQSNKGINLLALGEFEEAMNCFESAIQIDPKYWKAYAQAGEAHAHRRDANRAVQLLKKALEISPREAYLLALTAACLYDLGRTAEAKEFLVKAQQVNAQDPWVVRVGLLIK